MRIRIGDGDNKIERTNACIKKDRNKCSIIDENKFQKNILDVINHITEHFNGSKVIKHGYIEFFNYTGIQDFKKVFKHTREQNITQYSYNKQPNEVVEHTRNTKN